MKGRRRRDGEARQAVVPYTDWLKGLPKQKSPQLAMLGIRYAAIDSEMNAIDKPSAGYSNDHLANIVLCQFHSIRTRSERG